MSLINRDGFFPSISPYWEDFFGRDMMEKAGWGGTSNVPAVNIEEEKGAFKVSLAAPGLQREDFSIQVNNGVLTVSSKKEEHEEHHGKGIYTRREFRYRAFSRSFTLPESVDVEKIKAHYSDGILFVNLPKKEVREGQAVKQNSDKLAMIVKQAYWSQESRVFSMLWCGLLRPKSHSPLIVKA